MFVLIVCLLFNALEGEVTSVRKAECAPVVSTMIWGLFTTAVDGSENKTNKVQASTAQG